MLVDDERAHAGRTDRTRPVLGVVERVIPEAGGRDVDDNFGFSAFGWAVACGDESAGTGLRATAAVGGDGAAAILGGAFCLEALEMTRAS